MTSLVGQAIANKLIEIVFCSVGDLPLLYRSAVVSLSRNLNSGDLIYFFEELLPMPAKIPVLSLSLSNRTITSEVNFNDSCSLFH